MSKRTWRKVMSDVASEHGLTVDDLTGPRIDQRRFRARAEAMAILRSTTQFSLPQIGKMFNRDHTTVLNALRRHLKLREVAE